MCGMCVDVCGFVRVCVGVRGCVWVCAQLCAVVRSCAQLCAGMCRSVSACWYVWNEFSEYLMDYNGDLIPNISRL